MESIEPSIGVGTRDELIASFEKQVFDSILKSTTTEENVKQYIKNNRCEVVHAFDHRDANIAELDFRLLSEDGNTLIEHVVIVLRFVAVINAITGNWRWYVKDGEDVVIDVANDLVKHISNIVSIPKEENPLLQPPYDVNTTIEMMQAGGKLPQDEPIPVNIPNVTTGEITPPLEVPFDQEEATDTGKDTGFSNVRYFRSYVEETTLHRDYPTLQEAYLAMIKQNYYRLLDSLSNLHGIVKKLYPHDWFINIDVDIATLTRLNETVMMRLDVKYQVMDADNLPKLIADFKGNLGTIEANGHVEINDTVITSRLIELVEKARVELDSLLK
nr:MAG TPA: hypothetical protein [Caudoviricetes sp.]